MNPLQLRNKRYLCLNSVLSRVLGQRKTARCAQSTKTANCARSTETAKCAQSTKTANCARSTQTAVCSVYTNGSVLSLHKRQSVLGPHKRQIMLRLRNRQKACENSDLISLSLLVLLFRLMSTVSVFSSVKCAFRNSQSIKTVNVKSLR